MSISYSTLFGKIGKLIKVEESYATLGSTTLVSDLVSIVNQYGTTNTGSTSSQAIVEGINSTYAGFQKNVTNWRTAVAAVADATLTDYDTVTSQLSQLQATDVQSVLAALIRDMLDNSQSVDASSLSIGSVSAGSNNIGTATVFLDGTLDGFSSPVTSGNANTLYNGLASQLHPPGPVTHEFICSADSYGGGATEGSERYSWVAGEAQTLFSYLAEQPGPGPGLTVANSNSTVVNNSFDKFTASTHIPDNWTLDAGTAGTTVDKDTSSPFRGGAAVKYIGNGAQATQQLSQAIAATKLKAGQRWLCTIQLKRSGTVPAAGTLTISLVSPSGAYTAAGSEKIVVAASAIGTSYSTYKFYVNLPATLPSDLKMALAMTGTLTNGSVVSMDSMTFSPVTYFAGVNAVIIAGSSPSVQKDRFTASISNNESGSRFQMFARKKWRVQLPSSNSPTISNALAT